MTEPRSTAIDAGSAVDLTNCDREPIHIPGRVQSHGVLLVCGGSDRRVEHASANTQSMLGEAPEGLLGKSLATVIGPTATVALMNASEITQDSISARIFRLDLAKAKRSMPTLSVSQAA
jgi:light-regulated signal transduction histidine kinase (bacteriophytochrome)